MNKKLLYWLAQLFGWTSYVGLSVALNIGNEDVDISFYIAMVVVWCLGISISHLLRLVFIKQGWLEIGLYKLLPRVIPTIVVFGVLLECLYSLSQYFISTEPIKFEIKTIIAETISWSLLFLMWSLFYFLFHFFQNYRKEEIKNLKWEASKNEIELNRLRAQLNPHFIFNSMNTIRALVDENPKKAKKNITKLAKILRSTLLSEKKKTIPLKSELELVNDYLDIEHSRFEERLNILYKIDPGTKKMTVPPMMVQTLVENAIKHGISKLQEGGTVEIKTYPVNHQLIIEILNSGIYQPDPISKENSTGFGLSGTYQRLKLLYGSNASFKIQNENKKVKATLIIPQNI